MRVVNHCDRLAYIVLTSGHSDRHACVFSDNRRFAGKLRFQNPLKHKRVLRHPLERQFVSHLRPEELVVWTEHAFTLHPRLPWVQFYFFSHALVP